MPRRLPRQSQKIGGYMKRQLVAFAMILTMALSLLPTFALTQQVEAKEANKVTAKAGKRTASFTAAGLGFKKNPMEGNLFTSGPRLYSRHFTMLYTTMMDRIATPYPAKPDTKKLGFDPDSDEWKFPIIIKFSAGVAATGAKVDFDDPEYTIKPVRLKVLQRDKDGRLINTFVSDPLKKTENVKLKYADGPNKGQVAEKVRAYDNLGRFYTYTVIPDEDTLHEVVFEIRYGNVDSATRQDAITIDFNVFRLANSNIKYVFKNTEGQAYDKTNLKADQVIDANFFNDGENKNSPFEIELSKDGTVLRNGFGGQDLVSTDELADPSDDAFAVQRAKAKSAKTWAEDGYIAVKDKNDKDLVFKVDTSYTWMYGGVVTFTEQKKVIIPDDPGTGGMPTPCPSTHYEVNFVAGENGTLKTGMKTRFFVQKGLTWKEAMEQATDPLLVPTPIPNEDHKFVDWHPLNGTTPDKDKTLPGDDEQVTKATYQAEFTTKAKVVDVTPQKGGEPDPDGTPELPKKPNPDFDPKKTEDPNNNPKTIPDTDYELITFKSDDHGFLTADKKTTRKVYAVLKTSTWAEAEAADPKMDVPSTTSTTLKLTGADNYTFTKWTTDGTTATDLPQGTEKIADLANKTFIAKFEQDSIEREDKTEPIPDGYIRLEFSPGTNGKIAKGNTAKTIIDVLEKANKKVGDYTKPTITPNVGFRQKDAPNAWDKADTLVINSTNTDASSAKKNELTVTAQYDSKPGVVDITPTPPSPGPTPGTEPEDPKAPVIPGTKTPDPDYVVVAFKAGANGKITGGNKFYAVLKNMTWQEAEDNPVAGQPKLQVPSDFTPDEGYGFINWKPVIPADKTQKLEKLVANGEAKLTYTAKFGKDIDKVKEGEEKEEGYVYVTFTADNGKAGQEKLEGQFNKPSTGELQVKYKIRVGVNGVAGSTSSNKKYGDLERYTDPQITPPKDHLFDKWDQEKETVIAPVANSYEVTVHAQYKKNTEELITPDIEQAVTPNVDDKNAQKVVKVNFTNTPTTDSTAKLVKVGTDGSTTDVTGVTIEMKTGEQNFPIDEKQLKDGDKVEVVVSKTNRSDAKSNIVTLDLKGPDFTDFKIVERDTRTVVVTGKVTDPTNAGVEGYKPAGVHKVTVGGYTVEVKPDGTFETILKKDDNHVYTFDGIDKLGNKSQKATSKDNIKEEDKYKPENKKYVTIRQAYEGQKRIMVFGQKDDKVQLFRIGANGAIENIGQPVTISQDGRGQVEFDTPLTKWDVVYATVLINDKMDFHMSEPIGMIVWSRTKGENPPTTVVPAVPAESTTGTPSGDPASSQP